MKDEEASGFPDHFSRQAERYARHRPDYPSRLFHYIAGLAPARGRAWDCATGSGQAAAGLARHFGTVVATDASADQIRRATRRANVHYAVASAEQAPLAARSADVVTVAQALHWFDRARFWEEARRVLVRGGVIAVWAYHDFRVGGEVETVVQRFYRDVVGPYWPPERAIVERGYGDLEFPFAAESPPAFRLEKRWNLSALCGYLATWSATQCYEKAVGRDPLPLVRDDLSRAWGPSDRVRAVRWDLDLRVGRNG